MIGRFRSDAEIGHAPQIENCRLNHPSDVRKEGQDVWLKLLSFDDRGKTRSAMKMINQETGKEDTPEDALTLWKSETLPKRPFASR